MDEKHPTEGKVQHNEEQQPNFEVKTKIKRTWQENQLLNQLAAECDAP